MFANVASIQTRINIPRSRPKGKRGHLIDGRNSLSYESRCPGLLALPHGLVLPRSTEGPAAFARIGR
jgi:hypothetical protein